MPLLSWKDKPFHRRLLLEKELDVMDREALAHTENPHLYRNIGRHLGGVAAHERLCVLDLDVGMIVLDEIGDLRDGGRLAVHLELIAELVDDAPGPTLLARFDG